MLSLSTDTVAAGASAAPAAGLAPGSNVPRAGAPDSRFDRIFKTLSGDPGTASASAGPPASLAGDATAAPADGPAGSLPAAVPAPPNDGRQPQPWRFAAPQIPQQSDAVASAQLAPGDKAGKSGRGKKSSQATSASASAADTGGAVEATPATPAVPTPVPVQPVVDPAVILAFTGSPVAEAQDRQTTSPDARPETAGRAASGRSATGDIKGLPGASRTDPATPVSAAASPKGQAARTAAGPTTTTTTVTTTTTATTATATGADAAIGDDAAHSDSAGAGDGSSPTEVLERAVRPQTQAADLRLTGANAGAGAVDLRAAMRAAAGGSSSSTDSGASTPDRGPKASASSATASQPASAVDSKPALDAASTFSRAVGPIEAVAVPQAAAAVLSTSAAEAPAALALGQNGTAVAAQIVESMRLQWANGGGAAQVTLQPSYLGGVSISVHVVNDAVSAAVTADSPAVREWLRANEGSLRQGLGDAGLRLEKFQVSEPAAQTPSRDPESRDRSTGRDRQPAPRQPRRDGSEPAFDVIAE